MSLPQNVVIETYPSGQSLRFLCVLVATIAEISGYLIGFYGIYKFGVGWTVMAACLAKQKCSYTGIQSGNKYSGLNSPEGKENVDGTIQNLMIIITILAVAAEVTTALLITKALSRLYYQQVRNRFHLSPNNVLLRSTSILVVGICIYLTFESFCYLNLAFEEKEEGNDDIATYFPVDQFQSVEEMNNQSENENGWTDETEEVSVSASAETEVDNHGSSGYEELETSEIHEEIITVIVN